MKVLFIDPKASETYDFEYLETNSIGGTESTLLHIAKGLALTHDVTVAQLNRSQKNIEFKVNYVSINSLSQNKNYVPDVVIILRKYKLLTHYRALYPEASLTVWVHNFQNSDVLGRRHRIVDTKANVICVSMCHQRYISELLNGWKSWVFRLLTFRFKKIRVETIYNPVLEVVKNSSIKTDNYKLLFFSTPNKGLKEVLLHFERLVATEPKYHLYIAGTDLENLKAYGLDKGIVQSKSVTLLGKIARETLDSHIQSSFCVFYPQNSFAETFGLIYAEANRVGVPVLAADIGAASEVLSSSEQIIDVGNSDQVIKTLQKWQNEHRPLVSLKDDIKLDAVINKWQKLLVRTQSPNES